jgi:hypothetical protein
VVSGEQLNHNDTVAYDEGNCIDWFVVAAAVC